MRQLKKIFFIILITVFLSGCQDNLTEDNAYCFVGDSLIARWPLDETFPSHLVYNYGKSGARINYIQELCYSFVGNDIVVLIGTNDSNYFKPESMDEYLYKYLNSINKLTDCEIYLISVLPREFNADDKDINEHISDFNDKVMASLKAYPNIIYIDAYNDFMDGNHINYQYYSDGLHLNTYGYEILSNKLLHAINNTCHEKGN